MKQEGERKIRKEKGRQVKEGGNEVRERNEVKLER